MQRRTSRSQELGYEMDTEPPAATKPTETTVQNKGSTPILNNAAASSPEADPEENNADKKYLTGWKLHSLSAA